MLINLRLKLFITLFGSMFIFGSCNEKIEKEFGNFCAKTDFNIQRHLFSSDINGSVKFQLDESTDKSSGKLMIGGFSKMSQGQTDIKFSDEDPQSCNDCIFVFFRDNKQNNKTYRAISARINVELIYFDSKDRVAFAKGKFQRMVLVGESDSDCRVIEDMEFKLY